MSHRHLAALLMLTFAVCDASIRKADFVGGQLYTTRSLVQTKNVLRRRGLVESLRSEKAVWAVGLENSRQETLFTNLQAAGIQFLHPVPSRDNRQHHWLVQASHKQMSYLLDNDRSLTAELLPPSFKMDPRLLESLQRQVDAAVEPLSEPVVVQALAPASEQKEIDEQLVAELPHIRKMTSGLNSQVCAIRVLPRDMSFQVETCLQAAPKVVEWLASLHFVTYVNLATPMRPQSLHDAAAVQQPSTMESRKNLQSVTDKDLTSFFFPMWKAGLTGKGQVVGVVDTGIDFDSCYMYDPNFLDYLTGNSTSRIPMSLYVPSNAEYLPETGSYIGAMSGIPNVTVFYNTSHRKVVQYVMWADGIDAHGHGTHVSATLAGSVYGRDFLAEPALGTGIAPEAKLAMFDVGGPDRSDPLYIWDTQDLSQIFHVQREAGARITSNSWGSDNGYHYSGPNCYMMDLYAREFNDTLHVIAAGNNGTDTASMNTTGTVGPLGTCKNVLTVGATENWMPVVHSLETVSLLDYEGNPVPAFDFEWDDETRFGQLMFMGDNGRPFVLLDGRFDDFTNVRGYDSWFTSLFGKTLKVVVWSPEEVCSPPPLPRPSPPPSPAAGPPVVGATFLNPNRPRDANSTTSNTLNSTSSSDGGDSGSGQGPDEYMIVARISSGMNCTGETILKSMYDLGAAAGMMFADYTDVGLMAYNMGTASFPAATFVSGAGMFMWPWLSTNTSITVSINRMRDDYSPIENVAYFSAYGTSASWRRTPRRGFSPDVRIKPEIVAPGVLLSARSDREFTGSMDSCDAVVRSGTSMATPVVSGAAALVRQYFVDGYYPSGAPNANDSHIPSAPLLKAVLIAGAAGLKGISVMTGEPLAKPPYSNFQGFGRVDLSTSLPLSVDLLASTSSRSTIRYEETDEYSPTGKDAVITTSQSSDDESATAQTSPQPSPPEPSAVSDTFSAAAATAPGRRLHEHDSNTDTSEDEGDVSKPPNNTPSTAQTQQQQQGGSVLWRLQIIDGAQFDRDSDYHAYLLYVPEHQPGPDNTTSGAGSEDTATELPVEVSADDVEISGDEGSRPTLLPPEQDERSNDETPSEAAAAAGTESVPETVKDGNWGSIDKLSIADRLQGLISQQQEKTVYQSQQQEEGATRRQQASLPDAGEVRTHFSTHQDMATTGSRKLLQKASQAVADPVAISTASTNSHNSTDGGQAGGAAPDNATTRPGSQGVDGDGSALILTLAWHDIPAFPGAQYVLVNNLDLLVYGPLTAAGEAMNNTRLWWGNERPQGDFQNNIEKVIIPVPQPGVYFVQVRSVYLFWGARPQSYSLVALGSFQGILERPENPAYRKVHHTEHSK